MNQILKPHNLPPSFQGRGWKISIKSWWKPALFLLLVLYIFCLPSQLFTSPYSTVVTDRNGELLGARIATDGQWRFPPRDNIPEKVATCLIEFEDRQFYHHWGVNLCNRQSRSSKPQAQTYRQRRKYPYHADHSVGSEQAAYIQGKAD